jgi:hypothetical protein
MKLFGGVLQPVGNLGNFKTDLLNAPAATIMLKSSFSLRHRPPGGSSIWRARITKDILEHAENSDRQWA